VRIKPRSYYSVYYSYGSKWNKSFQYGSLLAALEMALQIDGCIYSNLGWLIWRDQDMLYEFCTPDSLASWVKKFGEEVTPGCICDQCQREWES
jgi:hypothetical protein